MILREMYVELPGNAGERYARVILAHSRLWKEDVGFGGCRGSFSAILGARPLGATFMRSTNAGRGSIGSLRPRVLKHTGAVDDSPNVSPARSSAIPSYSARAPSLSSEDV